MITNDILWKGIIENLLPYFLKFFFPKESFDLSRGYEFLDKELNKLIASEEGPGSKRVDKLIKVYTSSGEEKWILFHIEVQGYRDTNLPLRMFRYYYRILDHHNEPVAALAILTDDNTNYRPSLYEHSLLGTSIKYQYNLYKILDQDEEELNKMDNPFAIVIMTALAALKMKKKKPLQQLNIKVSLFRNLISKKFSQENIRFLMIFIQHYVRLNDEKMNLLYEKKVMKTIPDNTTMGIEEQILQLAEEKGLERGRVETEKEVKTTAARNMLREGLEVPFICKMLDMPKKFVLAIQKEMETTENGY